MTGQASVSAFETHPSLADRLAALPPEASAARPDLFSSALILPALDLLGDPDARAADLIALVEKLAAEQERRDSLRLRCWVRKQRGQRTRHTPGETAGMALTAVGATLTFLGLLGLGIALFLPSSPGQALKDTASALPFVGPGVLMLAAGIALMRLLRFKDRTPLPVPALACWMGAWEARDLSREALADQMRARQEAERSFRADESVPKRRKERALFWARRACEYLDRCDYVRAEAAAALCLEADARSVGGRAARGVSSAFFGDGAGLARSLGAAVQEYGSSPSLSWGLGWGLLLLEQWSRAEAALHEAIEARPESAALRSLCGFCQCQQGKTREAAESIRRGMALAPSEPAHRLLLARVLLVAGQPRAAAHELDLLGRHPADDPELLAARTRTDLLLGEWDAAAASAAVFEAAHPSAKTALRLADLYADAGRAEEARARRERLCASGFYPEALIGLARQSFERADRAGARALLLAALDMTRPLGPGARGPLDLMADVLRGLLALNGPARPCRRWAAATPLPSPAPGMRVLSLHVAAPSPEEAAALVGEVYAAMRPSADLSETEIQWQPLPVAPEGGPENGPEDGDAHPGVFGWRFS